jgi:hypothetical protein
MLLALKKRFIHFGYAMTKWTPPTSTRGGWATMRRVYHETVAIIFK